MYKLENKAFIKDKNVNLDLGFNEKVLFLAYIAELNKVIFCTDTEAINSISLDQGFRVKVNINFNNEPITKLEYYTEKQLICISSTTQLKIFSVFMQVALSLDILGGPFVCISNKQQELWLLFNHFYSITELRISNSLLNTITISDMPNYKSENMHYYRRPLNEFSECAECVSNFYAFINEKKSKSYSKFLDHKFIIPDNQIDFEILRTS